ncbi:hypothetical protein H0H81_011320 [Sphagnurus paluster]|uniref:BTB domain-containing protein n=1 Tax=Sphagnurus paluster TaxID=117069 RepID=A0A9P7KJF8_9AGAR|nr:hypothetical protein H0H81_011320 [Sphagnurus paluster]
MSTASVGAIRHVLETYPPSKGLFRELLQNSEDAQATKQVQPLVLSISIRPLKNFLEQVFVLDHRSHAPVDDSESTMIPGPALLAYNDSVFTERDFKSLFNLWDSSKTQDAGKIGKFGMGFRSTFHITDTPEVLSGSSLAILDPLLRLGQTGDIKLDLTQDASPRLFELLEPFAINVFQPNLAVKETEAFPGSIIRLPLRTLPSEISSKVYEPSEIRQLFMDFAQDEIRIALLFLRNIKRVEMYEINLDGEKKHIAISSISRSSETMVLTPSEGVSIKFLDLEETTTTPVVTTDSDRWRILHASFPDSHAAAALAPRLGLGSPIDAGTILTRHKLHPSLAIALPLSPVVQGQKAFGRLFTYLPLPLLTHFCAHVHALFALTPSREKLKNREDSPLRGSDHHIDVEWNKLLFEEYLPRAWMYLLCILKDEGCIQDIFDAWPPAQTIGQLGDSGYWETLPMKLLSCIVNSESAIWPIFGTEPTEYSSLGNLLVAIGDEDDIVLKALVGCGLRIVCPPKFIGQLIKDGTEAKILSPVTAHEALSKNVENFSLDAIIEIIPCVRRYLLSTHDIKNVIGLPIIPVSTNRYIALLPRYESSNHTMMNAKDFKVFGVRDDNAITLSRLEPPIADILKTQGPGTLNVQSLSSDLVLQYLRHYPVVADVIDDSTVSWLSQFWFWMKGSRLGYELYPKLQDFPLLPTHNGLKPTNSAVFKKHSMDPMLLSIMEALGASFLHDNFSGPLEYYRNFNDVHNLRDILDALTVGNIESFETEEARATRLIDHISTCITSGLSPEQRHKLRRLPIFPLALPSYNHRTRIPVGQRVVGAKPQNLSVLPSIPDVLFLAASHLSPSVIRMVEPNTHSSMTDVPLLRMGLDNFTRQSPRIQLALVDFMARYRAQVPGELTEKLKWTKFIPTASGSQQCPGQLIDPQSPLQVLFARNSDSFPTISPDTVKLIEDLRSLGLMQTKLSEEIVKERIDFIINNKDQQCARRLLKIIHDSSFRISRGPYLFCKWLPTPKGLLSPNECRDDPYHKELFDQVLSPLDDGVYTDRFLRTLFEWDQPVPLPILEKQLSSLLSPPVEVSYSRIFSTVKELARRALSQTDMASLKSRLETTDSAVFSGDDPVAGFFPISLVGPKERLFFQRMGCSEVPATSTILSRLSSLQGGSERSVKEALHLLRLLPEVMTDAERSQILVPDIGCQLRPHSSVLYNDLAERACLVALEDGEYLAHRRVDEDMAILLSIRRLGLNFVNQKPLGPDMGEEISTTIRNKLKSYTPSMIITEFLANAADAGATEFGIYLDEEEARTSQILTKDMAIFQACPSIVFFNNAVFTEDDFEGICKTGIGGKSGRQDTIGQFGLGALTMFHLSDLAMIVSGDQVMFLNPSKNVLPGMYRGRATLPLMPLQAMKRMHPHHLTPLDGMFGFDFSSSEPYSGTLFRLPLRNSRHVSRGNSLGDTWDMGRFITEVLKPFEALAEEHLLFTQLHRITINHRNSYGLLRPQHQIISQYKNERIEGKNSSKIVQIINSGNPHDSQQLWHVVSTSLKTRQTRFNQLAEKYRLRLPIVLGLAARVDTEKERTFHRFFSTLPLPFPTTLPVHVTAPFILSDDRRQIRLDDLDDAVKAYNEWLLSSAIPPLYMFLLADLLHAHKTNLSWWPGDIDRTRTVGDNLAGILTTSFYKTHLRNTDQRTFLPAYGDSTRYLQPKDAVILIPSAKGTFALDALFKLVQPPLASLSPQVAKRAIGEAQLTKLTPSYLKKAMITADNPIRNLKFKSIHRVIKFLLSANHDDLLGIPLLPLANGDFVVLEKTQDIHRTYFVADPQVHNLFPLNPRLVHPKFFNIEESPRTLLSIKDINVKELTGPAVSLLLKGRLGESDLEDTIGTEMQEWISTFWNAYKHLGILFSLDDIGSFPLVPTTKTGQYTSINYCKDRSKILLSSLTEDRDLWDAFSSLGLTIVARHATSFPKQLKELLSGTDFPVFSPQDAFLAMQSLQSPAAGIRLTRLPETSRRLLSAWCRGRITFLSLKNLKPFARTLPIWPIESLQTPSKLCPADDLIMLPAGVSSDIASRFVRSAISVHSDGLEHLGISAQTFPQFHASLTLPSILPERDIMLYSQLLRLLLTNLPTSFSNLLVPNGVRVLKAPRDLYARDNLFSTAFEGSSQYFVHEAFSGMLGQSHLDRFGLRREQNLDLDMFLDCARVIHNDQQTTYMATESLQRRATVVFEAYGESLSRRIDTASDWRRLDDLRFIPRNISRRHAGGPVGMDAERYCRTFPIIVSPVDVVLAQYAPIAWTQRCLLAVEPNRRLINENTQFGMPTFRDVAEHLKVLALRVLKDHPSNASLLNDLYETYKWLDTNCDTPTNKDLLLQMHEEPIFLITETSSASIPFAGSGNWYSADKLLLDETKPIANFHPVRGALLGFRGLLRAAGVESVIHASIPAPDSGDGIEASSNFETQFRVSFLAMRNRRILVDVEFAANSDSGGEELLPGHRAFLAAYSDYFLDLFTNDMESENLTTSTYNPKVVNVSDYSVRAVSYALDFAYMGTTPHITIDSETDSTSELDVLLEVLCLSDYWLMGSLHSAVQLQIIVRRLIDLETHTRSKSLLPSFSP